MQMSRIILLLALTGCDKSAEKVAALEERIDGLDAKAKEAEELGEANEKLEEQVEALQKRADKLEAEAKAAAEVHKADDERMSALQLEVDELKIRAAKAIEASTPSTSSTTTIETPEGDKGGGSGDAPKLEKVGVPACDDYLAAYAKCIMAKMPASVRKSTLDALTKSAEAFKQAASTPAGRSALEQTCKSAREAAGKTMEAMGCKM